MDFYDKRWGLWINSSKVQIGEVLDGCKGEAHVEVDQVSFRWVSGKPKGSETKIGETTVVISWVQAFFFCMVQSFENLAGLRCCLRQTDVV